MPGGGVNAPRPPAESAAAAGDGGHGGDQGEHGLDALAYQQRAGAGVAEADGTAVDTAERLARERQVRLRGMPGIEPCPMHANNGAVSGPLAWTGVFLRTRAFPCVGGDGGDQCRQAAHAAAVPVEEFRVEAQRGEAAAVDGAGPEIRLGVRAVDDAAAPP